MVLLFCRFIQTRGLLGNTDNAGMLLDRGQITLWKRKPPWFWLYIYIYIFPDDDIHERNRHKRAKGSNIIIDGNNQESTIKGHQRC